MDNELVPVTIQGAKYFVDQDAINGMRAQGIAFTPGHNEQQQSEDPGTPVSDFMRGGLHGFTLGLADKKFGDSNQSIAERMGAEPYDEVKARSPIATGVGDFAGGMLLPLPGAGVGAGVKGLAGLAMRTGTQAAVGAGMGGVRSYAEGEDPTSGALLGGALGGLGSAAIEGIGKGLQAGARALAPALDATADAARTRVFSIGGSDKQLDKLAERFGVEKMPEKLAALIEKVVPPGKGIGRNREEYRQALDAITEKAGPEIGALRQEMGSTQGVDSIIPQEWETMRENLQRKLDNVSLRTEKGRSEAQAMQRDLRAMDEAGMPKTLSQLADIKSEYQAAGHTGPMGTIPERAAAESAATIGSEAKGALGRLTDYALPETKAAHDAAQQRFAEAALLSDQITPKAIRDELNTNAASLGSAAATGLAGATLGGVGGLATDDGFVGGALKGGTLGAGLALSSGTRNLLSQYLAQPRAMDTIANLARQGGKSFQNIDLNKLAQIIRAYTGKLGGYAGS